MAELRLPNKITQERMMEFISFSLFVTELVDDLSGEQEAIAVCLYSRDNSETSLDARWASVVCVAEEHLFHLHLNISWGRWTPVRNQNLSNSRAHTTAALSFLFG